MLIFSAGGIDYVAFSTDLTFNNDVDTISFNITLNDDNLVEGSETFLAHLDIITAGVNITLFPSPDASVTILDDDSKLCNLTMGV